ncbi:MAG: PIN domain nuclease [Planctomycetes bacterium]|nr:PIN domain nuclease [Planctomycetota bacterium]
MGRRRDRPAPVKGLTFDAGALIAVDRGNESVRALLTQAAARQIWIVIPTGALAQAWRDGSRQARLAALLKNDLVLVEDLTRARAQAVGVLCGLRGTDDAIDAFVALIARQYGGTVITGDPTDLRKLDPSLEIVTV